MLHLAPIRAYVVASVEQIQLTELQSLGESRSSNSDLRLAREQRFRRFDLRGENHQDHTPLRLALGYDPRLGIHFQRAAAAGMPHQFLNELHVLPVGDENRRECVSKGMPPNFLWIPARNAAGRIIFCSNTSGQNGCFPWLRGLANIQSSGCRYRLVSFHSQRFAATRSSRGTGLRDASVLQSPTCRK